MRRVKRLNPKEVPAGQGALFSTWRHHAVFTDSGESMRAAGTLASRFRARATTATIRTQLIAVPARIARSARRLRLHLPVRWPWETAWQTMFTAAAGPPARAT